MSVRVFWLEPTGDYRHQLRRYSHGDGVCSAKPYGMSCHDSRVDIGVVRPAQTPTSYNAQPPDAESWKTDRIDRLDPRWSKQCACGYAFAVDDAWQVDYTELYEARGGARDGERHVLNDAPPGAMWDAGWYRSSGHGEPWTGPDGISLVVRLPNGGDWVVDGECSNCTRTQYGPKEIDGRVWEKAWLGRSHYCWVRHGDPRTGELHVDKTGETCSAGGGSIISGGYHGFLHNSHLVPC